MSSKERRKEKQLEWERELLNRDEERRRKEALSMYERIEESDASLDVKDILHRLANGETELG